MRARTLVFVALFAVMAAVCVRLAFWQLGRLHEKRAANAAAAAAREAPPVDLGWPPPAEKLDGRRVTVTGRFDTTAHVLLRGRVFQGEPGVGVVTPLVLPGDSVAVLVDRGWLPAADAVNARPQDVPEPGERTIEGVAVALGRGLGGPPMRRLDGDAPVCWSAHALDLDSLAGRWHYALAPWLVRALPGPGSPDLPRREAPRPFEEGMHLGYAVQWFLFALAALAAGAFLVRVDRRRAPSHRPDEPRGRV